MSRKSIPPGTYIRVIRSVLDRGIEGRVYKVTWECADRIKFKSHIYNVVHTFRKSSVVVVASPLGGQVLDWVERTRRELAYDQDGS